MIASALGETRPPDSRHRPERLEPMAKHALAGSGEAVGPAPIVGGQRLDPAARLEPRDRTVERAGTRLPSGERLDVLHHRVAVLGAVGQRDQDVEGRLRKATQAGQFVVALLHGSSTRRPYAADVSYYAIRNTTFRVIESSESAHRDSHRAAPSANARAAAFVVTFPSRHARS